MGVITAVQNLEVAIRDLIQAIVTPPHLDKAINRVRETAIIESGTVSTITNPVPVGNVATFGAYQAQTLVIHENYVAWALCVRARIT